MKSDVKTISVLFLLALYSFGVGAASSTYTYTQNLHESSEQEQFIESLSINLYCFIPKADGPEVSITTIKLRIPNVSFTDYAEVLSVTEHLVETGFLQHRASPVSFIVYRIISGIIYPFHTFI